MKRDSMLIEHLLEYAWPFIFNMLNKENTHGLRNYIINGPVKNRETGDKVKSFKCKARKS
jgi:Mn-dependent DtxR family transcriptional regulator